MGIISVNFNVIYQLLIRYTTVVRYWRKNLSITGQHQLFKQFNKAYHSGGNTVQYSH